jgi:hypothetical protein
MSCASNEYHVDLDARQIAELGGPPKLEASGDEAEFYACRFLLKKRKELITIIMYTALPRDPLTKGTIIKDDGKQLYAFGFHPDVVSAKIERRYFKQGMVAIDKHALNAIAASTLDKALVRSGFFELDPIGPWLLKSDESGELLIGEIMIDGRATVVKRYTGDSLPASACLDTINDAFKEP